MEVFRLITSDLNLCKLHELHTIYSLKDLADMLEILDVHEALQKEQIAREQQAAQMRDNKHRIR